MPRASVFVICAVVILTAQGCSDDSLRVGGADAPTPGDAAGSLPDAPGIAVRTLSLVTNSLVLDSTRGVIYASVPSQVGENGNAIATIDPETATVTASLFVGSEPNVMTISDDGAFLYVGLDGSASVRRIDLASNQATLTMPLGNNSSGFRIARDIAVMPGASRTIAVSRSNITVTPGFAGVVLFDDDVARPTEYFGFDATEIEFADATTLLGYDNADTSFALDKIHVDAEGLQSVLESDDVLTGFSTDFVYDRGQILGTSGQILDSASFHAAGSFAGSGPMAVDPSGSPVTFLVGDSNVHGLTLESFDRERMVPTASFAVPVDLIAGFSTYGSLVRVSATRFAFRSDDTVFILDLPAQ